MMVSLFFLFYVDLAIHTDSGSAREIEGPKPCPTRLTETQFRIGSLQAVVHPLSLVICLFNAFSGSLHPAARTSVPQRREE